MNGATLSTGDTPTGPVGPDAPAPTSVARSLPQRIGRYEIIRVLGEGGMGTVYEARQDAPSRTAALKVIRAGYLSPKLVRRFEHESQVLGRLQHPGIAQVYEAGVVPDERGHQVPFFAMEFIRGVDLATYAQAHRLGTRQRLELIARVCDAVEHAHQKGVIHRDLKPGNILVDESGQPKILDFGIARATDSDIQQTTMHTDVGQIIGTVPYMSPEQVGGDPEDMDTRSDVYALGVIIYELLAGRLPYDLQRKLIHDAARIIREVEPTRLSIANRALRGDVETIVAKALEKDKARRYPSAEAMASDIRRYLRDEPIAARPASTWYQLSKFARRNKAVVGAIIATFIVLVAGVVTSMSFAIGQSAARDRAEAAEVRATSRAEEAESVTGFLSDMLAAVNPAEKGRDVTVREILDHSSHGIGDRFKDHPVAQARLQRTIAASYAGLGDHKAAETHFRAALELRRAVMGPQDPQTLESMVELGGNLWDQGGFDEAERLYTDALREQQRILGERHEQTLGTLVNLGLLYTSKDDFAHAEPMLIEAVAGLRATMGDKAEFTLAAMNNLALLYSATDRPREAATYYELVIAGAREALGADNPNTTLTMTNLAGVRVHLGELDAAETLLSEAIASQRRILGDDHPQTMLTWIAIARLRLAQGRTEEAREIATRALAGLRAAFVDDHPDVLAVRSFIESIDASAPPAP